MTTVPGTYFTKEQLEAYLKVDNVPGRQLNGNKMMFQIGYVYHTEKEQYDKAFAWFILSAKENHAAAQSYIGYYYYNALGVPKNYLCALKWFLKSAEGSDQFSTFNSIGALFENGYGVTLDKYKALEWYCHGGKSTHKDRLKSEGYHRFGADKKKSRKQLIKETEAILDSEKKKLEEIQYRTQRKMEALEQLKITYKLVEGGKSAWENVPILLSGDKRHRVLSVSSSGSNNNNERYDLKKQIQLLKQDKNNLESQAKQLQALKHENTNLEFQIQEKDRELTSLRNEKQSLQRGNTSVQHQIKRNDSKMNSLQSENNKLKLKINSLEQHVREKDSKISSVLTENQSLKQEKATSEHQLQDMISKITSLENENRIHRSSSFKQTQKLETLNYEKNTLEQNKRHADIEIERLKASNIALVQSKQDTDSEIERLKASNIALVQSKQDIGSEIERLKESSITLVQNIQDASTEIERLKASNARLEQLLKSKEDATLSLTEENKNLSTSNQLITEMVETQKNLLHAKTSEMELLKQNMERQLADEKRRIDALEQENQLLKQGGVQDQPNVQDTNSISAELSDDGNAHNDINYDTEFDNTEESDDDDDDDDDDINYDTPSENEEQ